MASRTREQVKLESVRNLRARWRAEGRILVQADLPGELVAAIDRLKDDAGLRGRAPHIDAAWLKDTPRAPLFQTIKRGTEQLSGSALPQANAYAMIQRRAVAAGISTAVCNHTFRATGITAYLKNGGTLEKAANIANHSSTRTTQLYDRRSDDVSLDEIERILI